MGIMQIFEPRSPEERLLRLYRNTTRPNWLQPSLHTFQFLYKLLLFLLKMKFPHELSCFVRHRMLHNIIKDRCYCMHKMHHGTSQIQ